jgi:tRNA-specific 2-thiouridylase
VDEHGSKVGQHTGSHQFTVGQRRGLRLGTPATDGKPRYVLDISPISNTVTVGPRAALAVSRIDAVLYDGSRVVGSATIAGSER